MALIIPLMDAEAVNNLHESHGEKVIYKEFLKLDPIKTKDWVIYYSYYFNGDVYRRDYDLGKDITHIRNEIDFLILAPNVGIFVFEIKGGRITVRKGILYTVNRRGEEHDIYPYFQAESNRYSLFEKLGLIQHKGIFVNVKDFAGCGLVGFPDISTPPDVGVISNGHDTYVRGMDLYSFIMNASEFLSQWKKRVPTVDDINQIRQKLKGIDFKYSMSKGEYIRSIDLRLCDLTDEQTTVFAGLLDNPRCLIRGGAGTGKTVLCQFLFNKLVEQKKSVIYLSYNRLIASKVSESLDSNSSSLCMPIMDFLEEEYRKINELPEFTNYEEKKNYLYSNTAKLIDNVFDWKKYDCLIIDEAQDIPLQEELVFLFENLVNGELKDGCCYFFYDDNQKIFNKGEKAIYYAAEFEKYRYTKFRLTRNCRNSVGINNSINKILEKSMNERYISKIANEISNNDVRYSVITNDATGAEKISEVIDNLLSENVLPGQITLLFNSLKGELFEELNKKHSMMDYAKAKSKNVLRYSTSGGFKGLESEVIIYINNVALSAYNVHYVSISRAKILAYIFDATKNK